MPAGTGTAGANQNGPATSPMYSPGEIVTAAGPLSINAPAPVVDITLGSQFVTKAYDLAVYPRSPTGTHLRSVRYGSGEQHHASWWVGSFLVRR